MGPHATALRQHADAETPTAPSKPIPGSIDPIDESPPHPDDDPPISLRSSCGSDGFSSQPRTRPLTPSRWTRFWALNKAALLVALSQLFGATMNLCARLLELEGDGMHPVQVLFVRQSLTAVCCLLYMRWSRIPDYPFGRRETRWLLLIRGTSGFFGIFCLWYSMLYLPLADATVITFLAPSVAGLLCYFLLREPFSRMEVLATAVALVGVVLIAQPAAFFSKSSAPIVESPKQGLPGADREATAEERLLGVGVAMVGVLGAAGAFTTLRVIGKRVHPVMSVNAFAMCCTVICTLALGLAPVLNIDQPSLQWVTPSSMRQWVLLLVLGLLGFAMQYLLTAGLASDSSNRANSMVYTHMLFAVAFDRWVFGHRMGLMSFLGCVLILGSAVGIVVLLPKKPPPAPPLIKVQDVERQPNVGDAAESSPMLGPVHRVNESHQTRIE